MVVVRSQDLASLSSEITQCHMCPRLVAWREHVAHEKRAAFRDETYWAKPVPGFGDGRAQVLIVGLAPAAHGGNRTGRVFTGDRSGDFLFGSLFRCGFANQATSAAVDDGLVLHDAYVCAAVRCAPPENKPTTTERDECAPYLRRELELLDRLRVIVALGGFGYAAVWSALRASRLGSQLPSRRPRFAHLLEVPCGRVTVLGAFHPSQQNTFTGRLTPAMLDAVFQRAAELVSGRAPHQPRC
jgi:uracil-DNA glycosylase family 4